MEKINEDNINNCNTNIFGDWINNNDLKIESNPFDYIIINNFIESDYYNKLQDVLPQKPTNDWWKYENPIEVKYALDKFELMDPAIHNIFYALSHDKIIEKFKSLFNIPNLEFDPYCHGGGLHIHPRYGRLNMHLDYEKHPITNKQRRLNVILYLNDDWNKEWNGDTQLWNKDMTECVVKSYPKANTAIIFVTTEYSWHGLPKIITCPDNVYRRTLAYYYVSDLENKHDLKKQGSDANGYRSKAVFIKQPNDPYDERMEELYKIRPYRLITKDDMERIWKEWKINLV
jgi:hypothetical protein